MPSGRNIFLGLQITGAVRYTTGAGLGLVYPDLVLADPFLGHDIDLLHEPRLHLLLLLPLVLYPLSLLLAWSGFDNGLVTL
jgi:hypothetical protein